MPKNQHDILRRALKRLGEEENINYHNKMALNIDY